MKRRKPRQTTLTDSPVDYLETISTLEKVCRINSITLTQEDRISTGNLCLDLMLGGGLAPSLTIFSGPEQSSKTTTAISAMASSVNQKVGMRVLWDAEGSSGSSIDYVSNIFKTMKIDVDMETLFGIRKGNKYLTTPVVYYRDEPSMDTFFNWVYGLLKRLPEKRQEAGKWWYIYEASQENKAKFKGKYDLAMTRAGNGLYIPAEDGALQAMIIIDSFPALLPEAMDQDDTKNGMAVQAREFSQHLPRIKGRLRSRRVAILGINQLREKPGVMYGLPFYEPGGQALKFYSDVRFWFNPRALSGVPFNPKGKGQIEKEPSADGAGEDTYRYIHGKSIKNKLGIPNRETWLRIWVEDATGQANGLDPVWDTFFVLHQTGQLSGKRTAIKLNVYGMGEAKRTLTWNEFKILIVGNKEDQEPLYKKIGYRPVNLRRGLFTLLRKGVLEDLYVKKHMESVSNAKVKAGESDDEDDEDAE